MFRSYPSRVALPFACAVAVVLYAGSAHLQGQQAAPPATASPGSSDPQRFGVSTTAVVVDAVVRDKSGKPVTDLTAADFELYEDDVRQEIGNVVLVSPPPSAVAGGSLPTPAAPAPRVDSNTVAAPTFVALVFDRLSPEGRALAWKGAQAYLDTARANDFAGVFVVSESLEMVQTYTSDRTALKKALDEAASRATANFSRNADRVFQGRPNRAPGTSQTASAEEAGPSTFATPTNPGGVLPAMPQPTRATGVDVGTGFDAVLARVVNRTEATFESMMRENQGYATTNGLLALIDALSLLPGRKTVVFFAEGLAIPPAVQARFDSVVATANRANVSIYSVDSAGLRVHSNQAETAANVNALANTTFDRDLNAPGARPLTEGLEFNEDNLRKDPSVSFEILADSTGGFLINNTNNLARGFQTIDADRRFHYLLTYTPKNANFSGDWRGITVKVPKRTVAVRSRTGYMAVPGAGALPLLAYEGPALADLERTPLPADLPVRAGVFSLPDAKHSGRLALLVSTDAASVTFQPDAAAGTWRTDFTLLARIKDSTGEVVRKASQPYRLTGPAAQLEASKRGDVLFFRQPDLPPGTYTLESVVHDALSKKAGVATSSFVVPSVTPGALVASSLLIVRRSEKLAAGERTADNPLYFGDLLLYPNLGEPLRKSTDKTLSFFLTADPTPGSAPTATLEILQKWQPLAQLPTELSKPDATGRIAHAGQLPLASFPAGHYVLRVTVSQGAQKEARDATFTVVE
jgi:VWFA-related protein